MSRSVRVGGKEAKSESERARMPQMKTVGCGFELSEKFRKKARTQIIILTLGRVQASMTSLLVDSISLLKIAEA